CSPGRAVPGRPPADAGAAAHAALRRHAGAGGIEPVPDEPGPDGRCRDIGGHDRPGSALMSAPAATATPTAQQRTQDRANPFAGTAVLLRFLLRRDRIKLPAWVGGLGLYVVYIGAALPQLAPTEDDLDAVVPLFTQPVGR